MIIAKVIGNVVATQKDPKFTGKKLMIVQPIEVDGKEYGDTFEAVDCVQAGAGDTVLVTVQGHSARAAMHDMTMPIDAVIIAIVDNIIMDPK